MNIYSPDWALWRSFAAVIEHGSLSAAARTLGLSQPTLGRHIEALEETLQTSLFERHLKGLNPTEPALRIFEQVQTAKQALTEAELMAEGSTTALSGTVRITASTVMSHYILPQLIRQVRDDFPAIQIEIVPSDSPENLLLRESDIAIRMFRPTQLELITKKLGETPVSATAHTGYLARHPAPQEIADLIDHELIGLDRSELLISTAKQLGFDLKRTDFDLRTDNQTLMFELIKTGLGIGFAQNILIEETPGLTPLLPQLKIPPLEIWLTTHRELFTSARIRAIYDRLAELLRVRFAL